MNETTKTGNRQMNRSRAWLLAVWTAAALAGCATSPSVSYYQLEALEQTPGNARAGTTILALGPITFPGYLKRPQLVTRGGNARLNVDEFNRWAEPLDQAVKRILATNVDGLMSEIAVVQYANRAVEPDFRLFASIRRFDADESGQTVLLVQWGIKGGEGRPGLFPRLDRYEARAQPPGAPEAVAKAMSRVLESFSRDIASEVAAIADRQYD